MNANCALSLASRFGGMSGSSSMALKGWSFFKGSLWWILSSLGTCWGRGIVWWHAARARWRRWTNQADCWKEKAGGHFYTWPRFWWHLLSLPLVWLMLFKALPLLGSSMTVYTVCEPCLAQPRPMDDHLARLSAFEVPPVTCTAVTASQVSLTCLHVPYSCLPSRRFPSVRPRFDPRLQPEATSGGSPPMYPLNGQPPCLRHFSTCTAWPGTWPLPLAGCYRKGSLSLRPCLPDYSPCFISTYCWRFPSVTCDMHLVQSLPALPQCALLLRLRWSAADGSGAHCVGTFTLPLPLPESNWHFELLLSRVSSSPLCLYGGSPPRTPATPAPLSHPTQVRRLERCPLRDLTFSPGPPEFTFLGSAVLKLESACLPCALLIVFAQLPASAPHFLPSGETALMADRSVDEGQELGKG